MIPRVSALMTVMLLATGTPVHAQPADNAVAAQQLFRRARKLMKRGDFAAACPKLEASYDLDPATGTLLNLARCYEEVGKLASAWGRYHEVADRSREEGREGRAAFAEERAQVLEARIPTLVIEVPESSRIAGLVVERSGQAVAAALFGEPVYVDQGTYEVAAHASGHQAFARTVAVEDGQRVTVEIPRLTAALKRDPATPKREPTAPEEPDTGDSEARPSERTDRPAHEGTRPVFGLVTGSVGLAIAATGLGLALSARSSYDDAFAEGLCDRDTLMCNAAGQDKTESAIDRANIATVAAGVGLGLVVAGAVLYLTAPGRKAGERNVTVTPQVRRDWLGVAAMGRF